MMTLCLICGNNATGDRCTLCGSLLDSGDGSATNDWPPSQSVIERPPTPSSTPSLPPPPGPSKQNHAKMIGAVVISLVLLAGIILTVTQWGGKRASNGSTRTSVQNPEEESPQGGVLVQPGASGGTGGPPAGATPTGGQSVEDLGTVRTLVSGSWITVLESLPQAERAEADAWSQARSLSTLSVRVVVVDSSAVVGLNSGYWALAVTGSSSRDQARAVCGLLGRELGGNCYERQVG